MHYGEKYLHHYFAADRIGGEWFDLDNGQVMADVAPCCHKARQFPAKGCKRSPEALCRVYCYNLNEATDDA